jgi:hypothetical protein
MRSSSRADRMLRGSVAGRACLLPLLLTACAAPVEGWPPATPESWATSRARLAALRAAPQEAWAGEVSVMWREPRTGQTIAGRGGIGVAPGKGVRMILLGGPGMTMLDAWITPERWRIAVPPLGVVRRGGADEPGDLPVGFLRWWFFHPLEGSLVAATPGPPSPGWLLRDGAAVVEVLELPCPPGVGLAVTRSASGRVESIEACRREGRPLPGDRVRYQDRSTGLGVALTLEALADGPPLPEAFADPDAAVER